MKYFKEYNNNPYGENIDDCVIRAISLFTHRDYYEVFDALLLVNGHLTAIMGGVCYDTWDCGRYKCELMIVKEGEI